MSDTASLQNRLDRLAGDLQPIEAGYRVLVSARDVGTDLAAAFVQEIEETHLGRMLVFKGGSFHLTLAVRAARVLAIMECSLPQHAEMAGMGEQIATSDGAKTTTDARVVQDFLDQCDRLCVRSDPLPIQFASSCAGVSPGELVSFDIRPVRSDWIERIVELTDECVVARGGQIDPKVGTPGCSGLRALAAAELADTERPEGDLAEPKCTVFALADPMRSVLFCASVEDVLAFARTDQSRLGVVLELWSEVVADQQSRSKGHVEPPRMI